MLPRKQTWLKQ
uniref:Uncharacterized protein n=1 Tax=Rhizophora mucronata TaxID=61149 RepID=A0A2P2P0G7_RHIMU